MKENKIKYISLIIGAIVIIALLVWDGLTPSPYGELTINPSKVDWKLISWGNIDVNSLIHTILSAIIGFMLTIVVVEQLLRASRERELQYKRDLQFKNIRKIIQIPLFKYEKTVLSLIYGIGKIPEDRKVKVPVESKDLINVYEQQAYATESLFQTNIELYANAVDDLLTCITNIVLSADTIDKEELLALFSEYVRTVSAVNPCKQVWELRNLKTKNGRMMDNLKEELPKVNLDEINSANLFLPFKRLKFMIEYHEEFLERLYFLEPSFKLNESTE